MGLITTSKVFLSTSNQPEQVRYGEISRLLTAALVDRQFCDLLLTRPDQALANGYGGEPFHLNSNERQFFLATKFASLTDLAERWVKLNNCYRR